MQAEAVDRPAGPLVAQGAQVARSQQPDDGPRHAAPASVPMAHGAYRYAEVRSTGLAAAQQAAMKQLAEAFGGDVPHADTALGRLRWAILDFA